LALGSTLTHPQSYTASKIKFACAHSKNLTAYNWSFCEFSHNILVKFAYMVNPPPPGGVSG